MTAKATLVPPSLKGFMTRLVPQVPSSYFPDGRMGRIHMKMKKNKKIKYLGEGAYSIVIEHDDVPGKAIKITLSKSDGYHKYVQWVQAMEALMSPGHLKHLPKIYETFVTKNGIRYTVLEKLSHCMGSGPRRGRNTFQEVEAVVMNMTDVTKTRTDMGQYNTMYRGGTPVITDPWAHKVKGY